MKTVTLTMILLASALALAGEPPTPIHVVPTNATIHMGDGIQFYCPISNDNAVVTWQAVQSNDAIGHIDLTGYYVTSPQDNLVKSGSVLVMCQTTDAPGKWYSANLTIVP